MSGFCKRYSARAWRTKRPTATSLSPLLRTTSKPTTGTPSKVAAERASAKVSLTVATWSKRTRPPRDVASSIWPTSCAVLTVAKVRTGCSPTPKSMRPPEPSCCTCLSWRETSAAVMPNDCKRFTSRATRTSRVTPPTRLTAPTPRSDKSLRVMSLSTNQDRASSSIRDERTV